MLAMLIVVAGVIPTTSPSAQTLREWQAHSAQIEQRALHSGRVLHSDDLVRRGELVVEPVGTGTEKLSGGLRHRWKGAAVVPGVGVAEVARAMQRYDQYGRWYAPDVQGAKVLAHDGDRYRVEMRFREEKGITVMLDGVAEVRWSGQGSVSHMDEVRDESGEDHGFLWRMNTYWRFEQASDGVFLECEVVTLTRDVPRGVGWIVGPFLSSVPKESLQFTLDKTRKMLEAKNGNSNPR